MKDSIKAGELRLGNWVKYGANPDWIPEIIGKPVQVDIDILTEIECCEKHYYEPMPIHPEIAGKIKGIQALDYISYRLKIQRNSWIAVYYDIAGVEVESESGGVDLEIGEDVGYVHQLQNLFFAVSGGKELEITL